MSKQRTLSFGLVPQLLAVISGAGLLLGCTVDEVPQGLKRTPQGNGPEIRFNVYHKPLPEIPMPNDVAMWPDPTSRTGLRVNASMVAPTQVERTAREKFDQLEGWGTFAGVTVAFDKKDPDDPRAAIDLANMLSRHVGDDFEFNDDAVYLVNLTTGVPVALDLGEGDFQYVVKEKHKYWRNDTRRQEGYLLFESADETVDPRTGLFDPKRTADGTPFGKALYDPAWDTDFDGVIDRPNLIDPTACPNQAQVVLGQVTETDRDRCLADQMLTWYERETDTLLMRPLIPLEEKTEYAVVVTDRVRDPDGNVVKSPFDFVYHPSQEQGVERLQGLLADPSLASYYGDIGGTGLDHVAFAWTFTTQPVVEDLRLIRDGLYGTGPFAYLNKQFPTETTLKRIIGPVDSVDEATGFTEPANWYDNPEFPSCQGRLKEAYILDFEKNKDLLGTLASQFGIEGKAAKELADSWDAVSHAVIGSFESPFFIKGGPKGTEASASFDLDYRTGDGEVSSDTVQFMITVPKAREGHQQPFPVAYYGHGYTSSYIESLGFAGSLAKQGIAGVGVNAVFHGLEFDKSTRDLARLLLKGSCAAPFTDALLTGRARDLDGDGDALNNSGGDYWTSYIFHTRDVVRQSAVDLLQMFRILKSFDGQTLSSQDYDQDGQPNLAGDFDGDGTPDVGGKVKYHAWGQSLGGFTAPFLAMLDPDVVTAAPVAGAAGLLDVGARTFQGGVFEGVYLRNFGPLVVGVPPEEIPKDKNDKPITSCAEGQISLRLVVVDVNDDRELEFGCLDDSGLIQGGTVRVQNISNGEVRCGRLAGDDDLGLGSGRFRVGIPTSVGDQLYVSVYDQPDAVDTYDPNHGCNLKPDAELIATFSKWGKGPIASGSQDADGVLLCTSPGGCTKFQDHYYPEGLPLRAPVEGFGYIRQTPEMRRFMTLAAVAVDPGDPGNYVPYAGLKTMLDPWGDPHPATALLNMVTIGDMNVPLNAGISLGRVAGAIPFMRPDAASRYPAYANYTTPAALYDDLGGYTPNRVLLDNHVIEGVSRLERAKPDNLNGCFDNQVAPENDTYKCLPTCTTAADCESGVCTSGRCAAAPVAPERCAQYLFDPDAVDEGLAHYGEREAAVPLRLARIATPATPTTIDDIWAPRLMGVPFAPDAGGWTADARVLAMLMGYVNPRGEHGFSPGDPCQAWVDGRYYINLVARFFATEGADLYYLSHPSSHQCLAKTGPGSCSFVE